MEAIAGKEFRCGVEDLEATVLAGLASHDLGQAEDLDEDARGTATRFEGHRKSS